MADQQLPKDDGATPAASHLRARANVWQDRFLEEYARLGNVTFAARLAGVDPSTVRAARARQVGFAVRMKAAEYGYCDRIRLEIHRRAVEGVEKPVFGTVVDANGNRVTGRVGEIREYSDRMLELEAKARMPEEYGERLRIDVASEARRIARELGATPEEEEAAVAEAERILQRRREESRRRV